MTGITQPRACLDVCALPRELLCLIVLAVAETVDSETLKALEGTSSLFRSIIFEACAWKAAATAARLPVWLPGHKQRIRTLKHAEGLIISKGATESYTLSSCGIVRRLFVLAATSWLNALSVHLEPLSLGARLHGDSALPVDAPFVFVHCDQRPSMEPGAQQGDQTRTLPCVAAGCMSPASPGCLHCGKHGASGARRRAQHWLDQLAACGPYDAVRCLILVSKSDVARNALVRAVTCLARKQQHQCQHCRTSNATRSPRRKRSSLQPDMIVRSS